MEHARKFRMSRPRRRYDRLFEVTALVLLAAALVAVSFKREFNFIVSDGRGYYVYLPSLFIDGDLNFENQIREHWGSDFSATLMRHRTATGLIANRYPIGMSLTLVPAFLSAHLISIVLFAVIPVEVLRPDGYSALYQLAGLLTILALGLLTMVLLHRVICDFIHVPNATAARAVLLYWLGSAYTYYYFREPFMVHVISTFWVTATLYFLTRQFAGRSAATKQQLGPLVLFCTTMALLCRPTNAFLVFPILAACVVAPLGWKPTRRSGWLCYALIALVIMCQLVVWKILYGDWIAYSYENRFFAFRHPALIATLFSSRHGLFVWSPLLIFASLGVVIGRPYWRHRAQRYFVVALLLGCVMLWWLNSSWQTWWFGDAFGGRAYIEMTPLFTIGLALWLNWLEQRERAWKAAGFAALAGCVIYSWVIMVLYITHRITRSGPLF
jgi:hypothetical protein